MVWWTRHAFVSVRIHSSTVLAGNCFLQGLAELSLSLPLVLCVPFCVVVDPTVHHLLYEPFVLLKRQVDAVKGVNVRGYFKIVLISYFVFRCVRIGIDMGICKVLFVLAITNILFTFLTWFWFIASQHTSFFVFSMQCESVKCEIVE